MAKMTKSQIVTEISKDTGLTRKNVNAVFEALQCLAKDQLGKKGPGEFTILPGLIKARVRVKPAIKAGKWFNPFTKREEIRKAKPARRTVRLTALKGLKAVL
jgi:nucleoid DNA-binding protein